MKRADTRTEHKVVEGIETWRNAKNKFFVFQIHYTANPAKRSADFKETIHSSMPRAQALQEYELHWDSFAGLPVFQDFDKSLHYASPPAKPEAGLPLLRGWDFGLTPACVIAQLQGEVLVVLKEFTEVNMGAERFSEKVLKQCRNLYPNWPDQREHWRDFIDPSGEFRKDTDEGTCAKILDAKGLSPMPGAIAFEERRGAVEQFLIKRTRGGAAFQVNHEECPVLVRGFLGGYRYAEKALEIEPNKLRPLKDEHSHIHDALQMIATRIIMIKGKSKRKIPTLSYHGN